MKLVLPTLLIACLCVATLAHAGTETPVPTDGNHRAPPVVAAAAREGLVRRMLDRWHEAAAKADEAAYFSYFTKDAVFLGTDPTERWTVDQFRAWAHPRFAKGKAWTMHAKRRAVTFSPAGDVAWFDEDVESQTLGSLRGSGVVVKTDGEWKVAQYNLSMPVPNDKFKSVRALIGQ